MRVLITGGLGFLGRAVTSELVAYGHQVDVLTRGVRDVPAPEGVNVVRGDLLDQEAMRRIVVEGGYGGVCHLAALTRVRDSFEEPLTYYEVNVGGTINLLRALQGTDPMRLIYTSTNSVYGSRSGRLAEDVEPRPQSPYAASKLAAEQVIGYHADTGASGAVTLRCFNIAGAVDGFGDEDPTRLIPNVLRAAAGELPYLSVNGDGSAVREYVHVADVAGACRLALDHAERGSHETYNIGTGEGATVLELVKAAERVTGRTVPVRHLPPKNEPHSLLADSTRARQDLGWTPTRSSVDQIIRDAWAAKLHSARVRG